MRYPNRMKKKKGVISERRLEYKILQKDLNIIKCKGSILVQTKYNNKGKYIYEIYSCEEHDPEKGYCCNFKGKVFCRKKARKRTLYIMCNHSPFCGNKGKMEFISLNSSSF